MPTTINQFHSEGRQKHSVLVDMDGALLIDPSSFPYFALIAFDVGGILRLGLLLLVIPVAWVLQYLVPKSISTQVLIFATFAGVKVSDIESAAKTVLPKYYSEDLHPDTWSVFSSCRKKCVVTMNPRIMVEPFLKNYLDVEMVLGTEILSCMGIATGLVASPGVLIGEEKTVAVKKAFESSSMPRIGIGHSESHISFMNLCKEEYIVSSGPGIYPVQACDLLKPVIFHDGRLVQKPTPLIALLIFLWLPIGALLCIIRGIVGSLAPFSVFYYTFQLLGGKINVNGTPPCHPSGGSQRTGIIIVCSHKCFLDLALVSSLIRGKTVSVTYSISKVTELLSPMRTCRLTRDRAKDMIIMKQILDQGWHLVICPEGTTCREPYLLRFSPLFAELTDQIVPVAISMKTSMFYGSTARGYKWMDVFFLLADPLTVYEITFLNKLPVDQTCSAGLSSYEVANKIQEMIGETLKFKCTNLTRKDKYQVLAGTKGLVGLKP